MNGAVLMQVEIEVGHDALLAITGGSTITLSHRRLTVVVGDTSLTQLGPDLFLFGLPCWFHFIPDPIEKQAEAHLYGVDFPVPLNEAVEVAGGQRPRIIPSVVLGRLFMRGHGGAPLQAGARFSLSRQRLWSKADDKTTITGSCQLDIT
jgi:hypothetical protein